MKRFICLKMLIVPLLTFVSIVTVSCSNDTQNEEIEYDYLPVQLFGSNLWSIIDVNTGELLCKDEFKNMPSRVYNDVFYVQNDDFTFDFYNIHNVKTPINKVSYVEVHEFVGSDVTFATLPGKPISIINTKCEEIAVLDTSIVKVGEFKDGLARFLGSNGKWGFVNTKGEIVIKPQYNNVADFNNGIAICKNDKKYYGIDKSGKTLFEFNSDIFSDINYNDGYIFALDEKLNVIVLDKSCKKIFALCNISPMKDTVSPDLHGIFMHCTYNDGRFIFYENNMYGLKNKDNKIILRAKYEDLVDLNNGTYLAKKNGKYGIIDYNDNIKIEFNYNHITQIRNNVFIVFDGNSSKIIDNEGKDITDRGFIGINIGIRNSFIDSNYLDPKSFANKITDKFTEDSFLGYSRNTELKDVKHLLIEYPKIYLKKSSLNYFPDNFDYMLPETGFTILFFDGNLAKQTFKKERYYYWTYKVPTGYDFNWNRKLKCIGVSFDISNFDILEDKIAKEFDNTLKNKGYKEIETGIFESPQGTAVGLGYEEGVIFLRYYFNKGKYVEAKRIARKRKNTKAKRIIQLPDNNSVEYINEDDIPIIDAE